MEIRNLMEDAVLAAVGELFELEEKDPRLGLCTCGQCRLDVACYVLNRIKPEYILSGRGLAYSERDMLEKVQRLFDGHLEHQECANLLLTRRVSQAGENREPAAKTLVWEPTGKWTWWMTRRNQRGSTAATMASAMS